MGQVVWELTEFLTATHKLQHKLCRFYPRTKHESAKRSSCDLVLKLWFINASGYRIFRSRIGTSRLHDS